MMYKIATRNLVQRALRYERNPLAFYFAPRSFVVIQPLYCVRSYDKLRLISTRADTKWKLFSIYYFRVDDRVAKIFLHAGLFCTVPTWDRRT